MGLREEDIGDFKAWLLPKLDKISDADAEVLADYVIALVTSNESEESIRKNCLESLADFLQDNTAPFVDDIVKALKSKSYASHTPAHDTKPESSSQQAAPIPSIVGSSNAEYEPHPSHSIDTPPLHAPKGPAATRTPNAQHRLPDRPTGHAPVQSNSLGLNAQQVSRKRKQVQRDASETRAGQDSHYSRTGAGNRPIKQAARRGGRGGLRGGAAAFEPQNGVSGFAHLLNIPNLANLPPPSPGPFPLDANNPLAFFALMASLGTNMPGMPSLPSANLLGNGANGQAHKGKCHDYHTKGFCRLGMMCSFEHEPANGGQTNVPEYDPDQPGLGTRFAAIAKKRLGTNRTTSSGNRGSLARAPFSIPGPSRDRANATLVVEQIPEDRFSEEDIRGFFSEFGTILDVQMHAHKRLAIIKFEDHAAANRAYMSPKAVFENRFVKIYWYRQDSDMGTTKGSGDVEMADGETDMDGERAVLNLEEIAERQAEAQKAFEERRRKVEEADARAADIERQLKEKDAEMKVIKEQLAELAGDESLGSPGGLSHDLAILQAEAESLFAQTDSTAPVGRGRGFPPRGSYRGRGFAPFRGRGAPRGAYRGHGAFATPFVGNRSSVKRLDNRPRRLAVSDIEKGTPKDEALRQYLVNLPECSSIEPHPEQPNTVILTFQERYQAEIFLDNSRSIPDTGSLELAWISNDAFGGIKSISANTAVDTDGTESSDDGSSATVAEDQKADETEDNRQAADADMDVADDVDQWL